MTSIHRGQIFHVAGSPAVTDAVAALEYIEDGALVVDGNGVIAWLGEYPDVPDHLHPDQSDAVSLHDHRPGFVLPGFVDTHLHFPQTYAGDCYGGGQLLEWLERCIFPSEARYADETFAVAAAEEFTERRLRAGTTAAMVFGSAFPVAQDALFTATLDRGLRIVSGRGIQTCGPPAAEPLITGEDDAITMSAAEVQRWHGADTGDVTTALVQVALVPRFSLSVTPRTLASLGELYDELRPAGVYVHTHLNENNRPGTGEMDATKAAYGVESYLDTYDGLFLPGGRRGGSSLLGRRTIMAHAVHCLDRELSRMAETETSIAHCPVSQLFLGSGTMPWLRTIRSGVNVALGTDHGAGDEWSIARVVNDSYKVHISEPDHSGVALHPAVLLFTATLAGARALDQETRFGNFDVGKEADFLVIDPERWPPLYNAINRAVRSDDPQMARDQILFAVLMQLRESAIAEVHVRGHRVG
ncbi:amidohydrolase family protein [Williamsia sterculiae]|uniref:Guanine deaminase n=1 Tax=Williamsia sterculiae TaxID=1344003 RepID=A0A1N7EPD8_9NOCA|nr:amidohydrolase family protein [Williamsia sterculiae]SIR89926.1 guanine deaminase [Williamsia sterculiae]